jgi:hypothetical protein
MLLEILATLVISTQNIKETSVSNNISHISSHSSFIPGDSEYQIGERARVAREESERLARQREVLARERSRVPGGSYTGTGSNVEIVEKDTRFFNCVAYARWKSGINRSIGNGGRAGINTQTPQVGAIGVERKIYHAVYIEKIEGDQITIMEANYYKGWITRRVLKRSDFMGFVVI